MVLPNLSKFVASFLLKLKHLSNKNVFMLHKTKSTRMFHYGDTKPKKDSDFLLARFVNPFRERFVRIPYSNKFCLVLSESNEILLRKIVEKVGTTNLGLKFFPSSAPQVILTERVAKKILDAMCEGLMLDKGYKINGKMKTCFKNKQHMKQSSFAWKPETKHLNGKEWQIYVADKSSKLGLCINTDLIVVGTPFSHDLPDYGREIVVANILAHELGHAIARHVSRDWAIRQFVFPVPLWCLFILDVFDFIDLLPVMYLLITLLFRYISRRHEAEADYIGLMLMASAGYHPDWVPHFYREPIFEQKDGLFETHYSGEKRAKLLNRDKVMKEAHKIYVDVKTGKGVKSFV